MDQTQRKPHIAEKHGSHETALAFAAFVLAHADCAGGVAEVRLDDDTLACRCPTCDEARVFRSRAQPAR